MEWRGLLCAFGAAVAFGVQYTPVKRYEIFDGTTFQWFMCSGILMVGFVVSLATGDLERGCSELVVFGGALWALSNYFVLPLVKLLGLGPGFSLYHFVNLVVGYNVGRWGWFGVPVLSGNIALCDCGCALILLSFVVMVFVEPDAEAATCQGRRRLGTVAEEALPEYRAIYRHWRLAGMALASPPDVSDLHAVLTSPCKRPERGDGARYRSVSGFAVRCTSPLRTDPSPHGGARAAPAVLDGEVAAYGGSVGDVIACTVGCGASSSLPLLGSDGSCPPDLCPRAGGWVLWRGGRVGRRLTGVALAIAGGGICGLQTVPATLYNHRHPEAPPTSVVLPQCLGVWAASSAIYLAYAAVSKARGWKVPHAAIRPAYSSGVLWAVGFVLMVAGIRDLGYSVGYALDAAGPIMVSSLLSLLVFREIRGRTQTALYFVGFSLQLVGVLLIAANGQA